MPIHLPIFMLFISKTNGCHTWDEAKCPSGIISKEYGDTTRIQKAEILDDVHVFKKSSGIVYKCPVVGDGEMEDHVLFVTSRRADILVGQIISSEQAEGVLHRVGSVTDKGVVK